MQEIPTCNHLASEADLVGWLTPFDEPGFFFFSASRRALRFFFSAIIDKGRGGREDIGRSTPCCHRESARLLYSQGKMARVMLRRPFWRGSIKQTWVSHTISVSFLLDEHQTFWNWFSNFILNLVWKNQSEFQGVKPEYVSLFSGVSTPPYRCFDIDMQ